MKLVTEQDGGFTPEDLVDSTPYSIMFGPDKCGATNKVRDGEEEETLCGCARKNGAWNRVFPLSEREREEG